MTAILAMGIACDGLKIKMKWDQVREVGVEWIQQREWERNMKVSLKLKQRRGKRKRRMALVSQQEYLLLHMQTKGTFPLQGNYSRC